MFQVKHALMAGCAGLAMLFANAPVMAGDGCSSCGTGGACCDAGGICDSGSCCDTGGCGSGCCDSGCGGGCGGGLCGDLLANSYLFLAADGWKGPIDDDDNNNFGLRFGMNSGFTLMEDSRLGAQAGFSYAGYDFHGRSNSAPTTSQIEEQFFFTAGVFQRSDVCNACAHHQRISWGLVWDAMVSDNIGEDGDDINLYQLRGQMGYAIDPSNEVGLMIMYNVGGSQVVDQGSFNSNNILTRARALDQGNIFWRHVWERGGETTLLLGWAEAPGDVVFGARGEVPLNCHLSLFGNMHYILPSTTGGQPSNNGSNDRFAEEYWNVTFGFVYYPGNNSGTRTVSGRSMLPLLPVADNGLFGVKVNPNVQ